MGATKAVSRARGRGRDAAAGRDGAHGSDDADVDGPGAGRLARQRLTALLDAAVEGPLTVVCAPEGYGKTTALRDWRRASVRPSASIALGVQDDDPRRLCARLLAALERLLPGAFSRAGEALRSGAELSPTVVALILNALVAQEHERVVLVLDGVETLTDPRAHRLLTELLDAAPATLALVLAGRTPPPVRLARRRAARALIEIGAGELRFTRTEASTLLNETYGLRLDRQRLDAVYAHVDGRVAGLVAVAEALAHGADGPAVAAALTTVGPDPVERRLTARLLALLHLRAAVAFAALGSGAAALEHVIAADEGGGAVQLLRDGWGASDAPGVGEVTDLLRGDPFLGHVGDAVAAGKRSLRRYGGQSLELRAAIAAPLGLAMLLAGDAAGTRALLEPLVAVPAGSGSRRHILAALALAAAADGDAAPAERDARRAVALPAGGASALRGGGRPALHVDGGSALGAVPAHVALAEALRVRGRLDEAEVALEPAIDLTACEPDGFRRLLVLVCEARLRLARRERHRARACVAAARAIAVREPDPGVVPAWLDALELALGRGDDGLLGSAPTAAELRVLARLSSELTLEQIAAECFVSVETIRSHVRRLYRRLGARSRATAVAAARERGLARARADRLTRAAPADTFMRVKSPLRRLVAVAGC